MTKTFIEGDQVRVLPLDYLKPRLRDVRGVVVAWHHDNLYEVRMETTDEFVGVFEGSELEKV